MFGTKVGFRSVIVGGRRLVEFCVSSVWVRGFSLDFWVRVEVSVRNIKCSELSKVTLTVSETVISGVSLIKICLANVRMFSKPGCLIPAFKKFMGEVGVRFYSFNLFSINSWGIYGGAPPIIILLFVVWFQVLGHIL